MLGREVERALADGDRDDGVDQLGQAGLPATLLRRIVREPRGGPRQRRRVAAKEQEDDRGLTGAQRGRQGIAVAVSNGSGPDGRGPASPGPGLR